MRSRFPFTKVQSYRQSVPQVETTKTGKEILKNEDDIPLINYESIKTPDFRLAINGGFTYQFGGYDWAPQSYKDQVQTLWKLEGELHYFPFESVGLGAKYNYIFTPAEEDFLDINVGVIRLRDELITFQFLAFSVLCRNTLSDEQAIYYALAIGRMDYRTDYSINGSEMYESGNTMGVALGLHYDFLLSDNVGVGLGAEVTFAELSEIDTNAGSRPVNNFNISRIDLTLGLRFYR